MELVFGHGKWKCLGRDVAAMELNKVVPEVRAYLFVFEGVDILW